VLVAIAVILGIGVVVFRPRPAGAVLEVNPTPARFPVQTLTQRGSPLTITISSIGDQTARIGGAHIEPPGEFRITNNLCLDVEIPSGADCTITVRFRPRAEGTRTGVLVIEHRGAGGPIRLDLIGEAVPPEEGTPTPSRFPDIDVPPGDLRFLQPGDRLPVTIGSTGTAPLTLLRAAYVDPNSLADQFVLEDECGSEVAAGAACTIWITFRGIPELDAVANLVLENNVTEEPIRILLTGVPDLRIDVGEFLYNSDTDPPRWEAHPTLTNVGTLTFDVLGVTAPEPFVAEPGDCKSIDVAKSCTMIVTAPNECGVFKGDLIILGPTAGEETREPLELDLFCEP
jgi:hypothetical protein